MLKSAKDINYTWNFLLWDCLEHYHWWTLLKKSQITGIQFQHAAQYCSNHKGINAKRKYITSEYILLRLSVRLGFLRLRLAPAFPFLFFFWTSVSCIVHVTWTVRTGQWIVIRPMNSNFIIIIFYCFQFSIFSKISCIQTDPKSLIDSGDSKNFFLGWSLKNLNYTKFNKETIWIYQCHQKKKKKKHANTQNITNFFVLTKRIKKKRLIKDKMQIENVDIRIIKWPQQFHNKSYATIC